MEAKGIDGITIRNVADKAGYNSATLYLYFNDLDHLILYASLKYLSVYNKEVAEKLMDCRTPRERFLVTWETFCKVSDQHPEAFERIFFGPHSQSLTDICERYYQLFPEERSAPEELALSPIFSSFSLQERNMLVLKPLFEDRDATDEKQLQVLNELMVYGYEGLLRQHISNQCNTSQHGIGNDEPIWHRFRTYLDYLLTPVFGN